MVYSSRQGDPHVRQLASPFSGQLIACGVSETQPLLIHCWLIVNSTFGIFNGNTVIFVQKIYLKMTNILS